MTVKKARFWDRHADRYSRAPVRNQPAYEKKLEITRSYFQPDMEILEFGCGTGSTAIAHAPYVRNIVAADVSPRMLEIAQDKADKATLSNITFKQSSIEDFEAEPQSFDAILGLNILHLLEKPEEAIAKSYRLLKPGGVFVSSTACLGDIKAFWKVLLPIGRFLGLLPLVRLLTRERLEQAIRESGFEIDQTYGASDRDAIFIVAKK